MLHDDVVLELTKEVNIQIREEPTKELAVDLWSEPSVTIEERTEFDVIVDLESMVLYPEDIGSLKARIHRIILFGKSVIGKKTTFGSTSFSIVNNIQTIGTVEIFPENHNLVALPISFDRTISTQRTTFAEISFDIINTIQTDANNTIGGVNLYGSDLYGAGTYGYLTGYGAGAYGFGLYSGEAISLQIRFGSAIEGNIAYKQTAVAQVSLSPQGTPFERLNHLINIRARTTSGSTGVIRAALYEGATNRSGDLQTIPLTNTLDDYVLVIPEVEASSIVDYSNLSIKFWGFDLAGNALTFEIADIYLEFPYPTGSTQYGAVSRAITFSKSVSGVVNNKKTTTAEISLASHGTPSQRTNHSIKVRARTTSGSTGVLKAALYEGATNRSGDLITTPLTNALADYVLVIPDYRAATITDYSNLSIKFWGFDAAGNSLVFEVANIYLELPTSTGVSSKQTTPAQISLASHGTPSARTDHTIKVKARTISGSTGVLKAELYEGATVRSGASVLETPELTNSLVEYSLDIPEAAAATITNYSNLSIKFWGIDPAGNSLVFEVANIYLELPTT